MKKVLVIHTGGTISMSQDEANKVVTNTDNPISNHKDVIERYADVTEITPFNVPSPHMDIKYVEKLKELIEDAAQNESYDAFVITHGTDTLEETAYLLDLTIAISKPIAITGAMRSSNEIGSDGLYNFISAIRVATSDEAADMGVMVVFNDEIHHNLNIPLVKAYMGMNSDVLTFYSQNNVDGIIIEGLGQGNLPPTSLEGLDHCLRKNIPIVLVSRSFNGIVGPIYAYEGGGATLAEKGVIFSNGLNGPKARLKLLVGLSNQLSSEQLKQYFESQL